MASKHILKHTESEIVFKCYITDSAGGTVDLSVQNDMTKDTQVYVTPASIPDESGGGFANYTGSRVYISGIWWGLKSGKQLDLARIITQPSTLHNHYYLLDAGSYDFLEGGFMDRIYANKDIRLVFDGPGHCIVRLRKEGWNTKVEPATFGAYDDPTVVGS